MNHIETGYEFLDWIQLTQYMGYLWALARTVMDLQVPQNAENFLTSYAILSQVGLGSSEL